MTILNFSKTRIVYYDSNRSTLALPKNSDTLPPEVYAFDSNDFLPYLVYKLVGNSNSLGHNWHSIPYNHYGLYMTPAEINALYENSNSFCPVSMGYTIGHTIPLSKSATTNSTQLSFNNTIYSLIVDLPGNDMVTLNDAYSEINNFNAFCRTFDGSRYDDLKRNVLPVPDLLFKVPRVKASGTFPTVDNVLSAENFKTINENITEIQFDKSKISGNGYSQPGVVNAYIPEILQDNRNVKALYPGENQDEFHYEIKDKAYCTVPTDSINFNELFSNLDTRNYGVNSDLPFPNALLMFMAVYPVMKGPQDGFAADTTTGLFKNSPYDADNTKTDDSYKLSRVLWSEIMQSKHGMRHKDLFTANLPHKLIKCLPIMAQDDTPVIHTICATVTWEISIEVTDRMYKSINPYKWEMVWPHRFTEYTITANKITKAKLREAYVSKFSQRPLNDAHYKDLQTRHRHNYDFSDTGNYNTKEYTPPQIISADNNDPIDIVPTAQEIKGSNFTPAAYNNTCTASFKNPLTSPAANTRSKRHMHARHHPHHSDH